MRSRQNAYHKHERHYVDDDDDGENDSMDHKHLNQCRCPFLFRNHFVSMFN